MNGSEPAFPVPRAFVTERDYDGQVKQMIQCLPGMTKREYFAVHLLAGQLSGRACAVDAGIAATCAVIFADALIAELAKGEQ